MLAATVVGPAEVLAGTGARDAARAGAVRAGVDAAMGAVLAGLGLVVRPSRC